MTERERGRKARPPDPADEELEIEGELLGPDTGADSDRLSDFESSDEEDEDWEEEEAGDLEEDEDLEEEVEEDFDDEDDEADEDDEDDIYEAAKDEDVEFVYLDELDENTTDESMRQGFAGSRQLDPNGQGILSRLAVHTAMSPDISAEDVDAAWDQAFSGEETVGGSAPTPDQDIVDEIGEAAGLVYQDDEELNTQDKLARRDRERWELNPTSRDDENEGG